MALVWSSCGSGMAKYGMLSIRTVFNDDGSITETYADNSTKTTVFGDDVITETVKDSSDTVLAVKTTTFNADGSIDAVVS